LRVNEKDIQESTSNLRKIREQILRISSRSKEGHVPSSLSVLNIIYAYFSEFTNHSSETNSPIKGSSFVLSKGHASLGLYAVLNHFGLLEDKQLENFCKFDSILGGHPDRNKVPHVPFSTGSLGHGLPLSIGMAIARKISRDTRRVYCLIGDGESNEGTIWESLLLAGHHKLSNVTCIVDCNKSSDRALTLTNLESKFKAFDWFTVQVDGHSQLEISGALRLIDTERPVAVIARTIKGFGISSMENNPVWHHRSPSSDELIALIEEIK
jgi:transketolase